MSSAVRFGVWLAAGLFCLSLWLGWFDTSRAMTGPGNAIHRGGAGVQVMGDGDDTSFVSTEALIACQLFQFHEVNLATDVLNRLGSEHHRQQVVLDTFKQIIDNFPDENREKEHPPADARSSYQSSLTSAVNLANSLSDPKSRALALSRLADKQMESRQAKPTAAELARLAAQNLKLSIPEPTRLPSQIFKQIFGSGLLATFVGGIGAQLILMMSKFRDTLTESIAKKSAEATGNIIAGNHTHSAKGDESENKGTTPATG